MFWRNILFALIIGLLLTFPLHGAPLNENPCQHLAEGLMLFGAENIHYRGTYFISTEGIDREQLARQIETVPAPATFYSADWRLGSGLDETYVALQVRGDNYRDCRDLADSLTFSVRKENRLLGVNWHLECYLREQPEDMVELGRTLVKNLGGSLHSIRTYNGNVYVLAYVPWSGDMLMLEDGPVNLNLELFFEPASSAVRLHAGSPVLLTLAHYEEL